MITTAKGQYLSEFTPEMMKKVKEIDQYFSENEICILITGKDTYEHRKDYIKAYWDYPFKYELGDELENKDVLYDLEDELSQVAKDAMKKHLSKQYIMEDYEVVDKVKMDFPLYHLTEEFIEKYRTKRIHVKYPETSQWTFEQLMKIINDFTIKSDVLFNFILDKVIPIIRKNFKRKQEQDRKKRNLEAQERQQAKKHSLG